MLLSSSTSSLWVPLPEGCIETDPKNCEEQRGGLFDFDKSSTWKASGLYELLLEAESSLGYSGNSLVGFDNITLGWLRSGGPSFNNTVVTGVAIKDFFTGQMGLDSRPVNFTNLNDHYSSLSTSLFEAEMIPSPTWSYTAGAPYRPNKAYGSLTMGGYDAARSHQRHNLTFKIGVDTTRDLLVAITNISSDGKALLNNEIFPFVNSADPDIWLPLDACAWFEEVFGLKYDNMMDLYLVSDALHEQLLISNANVTISLTSSLPTDAKSSSSAIDINLPYGALDMVAGYPLASPTYINATLHYFPLRRASNSSQYTLGRTFLQEAYLCVEYGRSNFTVSQTQVPPDPAHPG